MNYALVFYAVCFTAYEFIRNRYSSKRRKFRTHAQLDLIVILTATFILTSTIRLDIIARSQQNLLPPSANFYDDLLRERITFLESGIKKGELIFDNGRESVYQLLKIVYNAKESYVALNTYTASWKKEISGLSQASIAAARKGTSISRCFVIKREYFEGELKEQYEEMKREFEGNIKVFYVKRRDAESIPFFNENNLRSMSLVDAKILVTDNSPKDANGSVTSIKVSWDKSKVINNPFDDLKEVQKDFNPDTFFNEIKVSSNRVE